MSTYDNIDVNETLASTTQTALKGGAQFTAHVVDTSLSSDNVALGGLVVVLVLLTFVIVYAKGAWHGRMPKFG